MTTINNNLNINIGGMNELNRLQTLKNENLKKIKKLKAESVGFQKLLNKYDIKQLTQKQNEYNQKIKTITNQMKNELNQLFEEKKIVHDQLIEIDKKLKYNRILIKNLKDPRNKTIVEDSLNKFNKQKKQQNKTND